MNTKNKLLPLVTPGEMLVEEFLKPLGLTEYRLAKDIEVPPRRINEIVHGKRAITTEMMGTVAINNPVSELDSCCSASESSHQGPIISSAAKASTHGQRRFSVTSMLDRMANGSSSTAPMPVRASTTTGGETSATATLIIR